MTDPVPDPTLDTFADLPLQPSGSGVADLEVAYEQMRLAEEGDTGGHDTAPVIVDDAAEDSAAHPS